MRRRCVRRDEAGAAGLVELVIGVVILALVSVAFYGSIWGFFRDTGFTEDLAQAGRDTRPLIRTMVIELRQAEVEKTTADGEPVAYLSPDKLIFFSDRYEADGPERFEYERINCTAELCELQVTVHEALVTSVPPNWDYDTGQTPFIQLVVGADLDAVAPLFTGVTWDDVGGAWQEIAGCDRDDLDGFGAVACAFDVVQIDLAIDPNPNKPNPRLYEVLENVRMRNAIIDS